MRITAVFRYTVLLIAIFSTWVLPAQQASSPDDLSAENRALFEALRGAAQKGDDAEVLAKGRELLPALKPETPFARFVTQITAQSAAETGETSYALTLVKPLAEASPEDWRAATLLARLYAESADKTQRDQQIARVIALHEKTSDPDFTKLHVFPIQRVKLHSGYAVFLFPFKPVGRENSYLVALVYTSEGKLDYRIELESADVDQAFFKPKHAGERRFSIDTFREQNTDGKASESQALHGFVDGVFDYDRMRDLMVKAANDEKLSDN